MELLKLALFVVLLTTISAKPTPSDANITEHHSHEGILSKARNITSSKESSESSSSSESSESSSSSESSEEKNITDKPTVVQTTVTMTTITSGDESNPTPEPNTYRPTAMETTPAPVTLPNVTTHFTKEIPTPAPVTQIRGDM